MSVLIIRPITEHKCYDIYLFLLYATFFGYNQTTLQNIEN